MKTTILSMAICLLFTSCLEANPVTCSDIDISISALYWQAAEEGLDYAIQNSNGSTFINNDGKVQRVSFDWDPGFKIGLACQVPCRQQIFSLAWTRFYTSGTSASTGISPEALFPVWTSPNTMLTTEEQMEAKITLHLNTLDLKMQTCFSPQCYFLVRPFIGLMTAWVDQKFNINANGGASLGPFAFVLDDGIEMTNNFWGIGPKVGVNTVWDLICGFSIFGNVDFAILYGQFNISQNETVLFSNNVPETTFLDINDNKFSLSRAFLGMQLGARWDRCFYCDRYHVYVEAGWEHQYFFGQNQLMRFADDLNSGINTPVQGDLTLQGLTVTIGLDF